MAGKSLDPKVQKRVASWLEGPFDEETKSEIRRLLKEDPTALANAFFKDLSFGTGGMRGLMGVGANRMNRYTIGKATQGLANYLKKQPEPEKGHSVFIGYDVRHHSREFAEETARVLSANGIRALLSREVCPTPLVSFACRFFQCSGAVMITASHNPKEYNGYKVYGPDGCQVVFPHDAGIMEEVSFIESPSQVLTGGSFEEIGKQIDRAYLVELRKLQMLPELAKIPLEIIYTNLHGTGIRLLPEALKEWGYKSLSFVEAQKSLDGDFPNAPSPNPEEEKALALGSEMLVQKKADLLIATDPDADRVGIAVLHRGKAVRLTGNQTACLCIHHICNTLSSKGELPENAAFIKTIVTTELFAKIAESFDRKCVDVLTGFKYIGEQIALWEKGDGYQFIFGGEESYGYLFGTFVRDKDAISSSCLIAEIAALAKKEHLTLIDRLHQIYKHYGLHRESLSNLSFPDSQAGMKQMQELMQRIRKHPPTQIGNRSVVQMEDYFEQTTLTHENGKKIEIELPKSDVLRLWLDDGSKLVIRPSGTEPKVKIYAEIVEKDTKDIERAIVHADERLKTLVQNFSSGL